MVNSHKTEINRFGYANKLVAHHFHHNFHLSLFNYLLFTILHEFFNFSPNKTFLNLITFFPKIFTFSFFTMHYYYSLSPTLTKITSILFIFTILHGHYYFRDKVQNSYVIFWDSQRADMRNCPEPIGLQGFKCTSFCIRFAQKVDREENPSVAKM